MKSFLKTAPFTIILVLAAALLAGLPRPVSAQLRFGISFPDERSRTPLDGRLLLLISTDDKAEPRFQITAGADTQLVFGIDVDGLAPGAEAVIDASAFGYPLRSLAELPRGEYFVQALLHRYETFHRADGHVVKVAELGSVAYADIGKKDGVLLGMPFSVFSPAEFGKEEPRPKASARVVRIMDDASELRVTVQGNEPIVAGDVLHNPVYDRGRRLRFLLIGKIDMDGDGTDDSGSLKAYIQELGGRVETELSVQTDYLIAGEQPVVPAAPGPDAGPMERQLYDEARAAFVAYTTAMDRAKDFGIPILSLNRFLGLMGLANRD
jgi:hypothetical protein